MENGDLSERIRLLAPLDPEPEPAEGEPPPRTAPLRLCDELDSYLPPRDALR